MGLREICQGRTTFAAPAEFRWPELTRAAKTIEQRWSDQPVVPVPSFQLEPLKERVLETWKRDRHLDALIRKDARWVPHILYHPEVEREAWLAHDSNFVDASLRVITRSERSVRTL